MIRKTNSGSLRLGGNVFARRCEGGFEIWVRDCTGWFDCGLCSTREYAELSMTLWDKELREAKNGFVIKPNRQPSDDVSLPGM